MKLRLIIPVTVLFFTSCAMSNRIREIHDPYKGINGLRLYQTPKAFSSEKIATVYGRAVLYPLSTTYLYEEAGKNRPTVSADFQMRVPVGSDDLDSVLFFNLDGEKIRISVDRLKKNRFHENSSTSTTVIPVPALKGDKAADKTNTLLTTTTESYQLMALKFAVPENLWASVAGSKEIQFRFYLGKEGIDVKLNLNETTKLREFFSQAGVRCNTLFPAIPEGKKKW